MIDSNENALNDISYTEVQECVAASHLPCRRVGGPIRAKRQVACLIEAGGGATDDARRQTIKYQPPTVDDSAPKLLTWLRS